MTSRTLITALMGAVATVALSLPGASAFAQEDSAVTIALRVNINTLDPHMSASVGSDLSVLSHIYPSLVIRGPDLALQPALAASWEPVDDLTWRFELVEGATFANGEPADAAAVLWNLERVRDPAVGARIRPWFDLVEEVRVVSDTVVEIETASPYPALADQLSMFFLLPPEWAAAHEPARETMSGGRYVVADYVPGDHIVLEANPDYWGEPASIERVIFRTIPEGGSRIAALIAGEVDLITGIPVTEIARINERGTAEAGAIPSIRSVFIKFNTEKEPLDNRAFRQALNYAIDKEGIVAAIFGGEAEVSACQVLAPPYFGYNPELEAYPYDPARAAELLAQSGVPAGTVLQMDVPAATYLQGEEVAQIVAYQLEELGLTVEITEMDFGAYLDRYLRANDLAQISLLGQAWPTIDADGLLTLFAPGNQYAYWHDEAFGDLLEQGRSTTDPEERRAIYAEATRIMCEEAPVIFLYMQPATYGVSTRVDWHARGDDWVRAFDMTLR